MSIHESRRRSRAVKISEQDLLNTVVELAKLRGWRIMHTRPAQNSKDVWSTPLQGHPGFFDLVLARKGLVLFVELKSAIGQLTQDQKDWAETVGGTLVWRPADLLDGTISKALA